MKRKNIAVILSGGSGTRFGGKLPKQFIMLGGKKIIEYTLERFNSHDEIDEICIVINPDHEILIEDIISNNNFKKVKKIIYGGKERYESSYSAVLAYKVHKKCNLIYHDAVRPFVPYKIISNVIKALDTYQAIDVAIPATDTIIQVDQNQLITNIPNRKYLQQGQTPQAFRYETIAKAYKKARDENFSAQFTDDCGLIVKYLPKEEIYVVDGDARNIKITHKEDLLLAEKLLQLQSLVYTKKHKNNKKNFKDKVIVIFGGSSGIGKEMLAQANLAKAIVYSFSQSSGVDIKNTSQIKNALEQVYLQHKRIDFIVNSVGVLSREQLSSMQQESIDQSIDTNFKGAVSITQASFKYLKKSNGHLLLFTSSSYTRGRSGYSIYSATKAAIVNFMQAIAQEWAIHNIKINAINPSRTDTPMRTKNFGLEDKKTLLPAKEVASIALSILREQFSGQVIDIKKSL